jgi:hypothetical protein
LTKNFKIGDLVQYDFEIVRLTGIPTIEKIGLITAHMSTSLYNKYQIQWTDGLIGWYFERYLIMVNDSGIK